MSTVVVLEAPTGGRRQPKTKIKQLFLTRLSAAATAILLSACGSGGDTSQPENPNRASNEAAIAPGIYLLAGHAGGEGFVRDGMGTDARFKSISGMAFDASGDLFLLDDVFLRKITPDGNVKVIAGSAASSSVSASAPPQDGRGVQAKFRGPSGLDFDGAGSLYILDECDVRRMTPDLNVTTVGDRMTSNCGTKNSLVADTVGNLYYFSTMQSGGYLNTPRLYWSGITKFSDSAGVTPLVSSTKPGAYLGGTADKAGNVYYIDEQNTMYRMEPNGTTASLFTVSRSVRTADGMTNVSDLVRSPDGTFYMVLAGENAVYRIAGDGQVTAVAGASDQAGNADGIADGARFRKPMRLALDRSGNLFVSDNGNHTLRKITPAGIVSTFAGTVNYYDAGTADGKAEDARFTSLKGVATDLAGNVYMTDSLDRIARLTPSGQVNTVYKYAIAGPNPTAQKFQQIVVDRAGNIFAADVRKIYRVTPGGELQTFADGFSDISSIAIDSQDNVYVADGREIRKLNVSGQPTKLAGSNADTEPSILDGTGGAARLMRPGSLAFDKRGDLYFLDAGSLRKLTLDGKVMTIAFSDERLNYASGMALGADGNFYVTLNQRNLLMKVTPAGTATVVAGTTLHLGTELGPLPGALGNPVGIAHLGANAFAVTLPTAVVKVQLP